MSKNSENLIVKLADILGKKATTVKTGAELLLTAAIAQYCKIHSAELNCTDLKVNPELQSQAIYAYACSTGVRFKNHVVASATFDTAKFYPDLCVNVEFEIATDPQTNINTLILCHSSKNTCLKEGEISYSYVFVLAKVLTDNFFNGTHNVLYIDQRSYNTVPDEYSMIDILQLLGNKYITSDMCLLSAKEFDTSTNTNRYWVAYCTEFRLRGWMLPSSGNAYTVNEKKARFKSFKLAVGDVVLLYKRREQRNETDITTNIESCYPAIFVGETKDGLSFIKQITTSTKLTQAVKIKEAERDGANIYTKSDIDSCVQIPVTISWVSLGVEACSFHESSMLFPLTPDFCIKDGTTQMVVDKDGNIVEKFFNTAETIYAVLEDWGIQYNKQRFLATGIIAGTPMYDIYKNNKLNENPEVIHMLN